MVRIRLRPREYSFTTVFFLAVALFTSHAGVVTFDTAPYWPTVGARLAGFGPGQSSTVAQTFVAPEGDNVKLKDFTFYAESFYPYFGIAHLRLRAFVFEWAGNITGIGGGAVGAPLFLGPPFPFSPPPRPDGWVPLTASMGDGVALIAGRHYVMGFTLSDGADYAASSGDIEVQIVPVRNPNYDPSPIPVSVDFGGGGAMWLNNSNNFAALNSAVWNTWGDIGVLAFTAHLAVETAPIILCSSNQTVACGTTAVVANIIKDLDGEPLQIEWLINGQSFKTNNYPGSTNAFAIALTNSFPLGTNIVTIRVNDGVSTVECNSSVVVTDTTAPDIKSIRATPAVIWPPNHKLVPVAFEVNAEDCGSVIWRIDRVESNESEAGPGSDNTSADWIIRDDHTAFVRAERSARGTGRVYTIWIRVTDDAGNSTATPVQVIVPHGKAKLVRKLRR